MCKCLNCPNGEISFSKCWSDFEACEVQSYKITCRVLNRVVINDPEPRRDLPAPTDCPMPDSIKEDKSFFDYIMTMRKE